MHTMEATADHCCGGPIYQAQMGPCLTGDVSGVRIPSLSVSVPSLATLGTYACGHWRALWDAALILLRFEARLAAVAKLCPVAPERTLWKLAPACQEYTGLLMNKSEQLMCCVGMNLLSSDSA